MPTLIRKYSSLFENEIAMTRFRDNPMRAILNMGRSQIFISGLLCEDKDEGVV